ncbi:MAG: RNA polymerase sigma factor region1.1 domain-containing protein [Xanthobacteraceae bacterium]|nr:RNA polymerase sigma factor region1.1 domain-containing protein [Xanthobacteraceae bacterium]
MDDPVEQAIQRASETAAQVGQITFAQLDKLLPPATLTSRQIEQVLNRLAEMGIHVVEADDN